MAVRTAGRCRRVTNYVATRAWSPIVRKGKGEGKGRDGSVQRECKKAVAQLGSLNTCRYTTTEQEA